MWRLYNILWTIAVNVFLRISLPTLSDHKQLLRKNLKTWSCYFYMPCIVNCGKFFFYTLYCLDPSRFWPVINFLFAYLVVNLSVGNWSWCYRSNVTTMYLPTIAQIQPNDEWNLVIFIFKMEWKNLALKICWLFDSRWVHIFCFLLPTGT